MATRLDYPFQVRPLTEEDGGGYLIEFPDLPGCVAVGDTIEETQREIQEAIEFHLEGLRADGLPVPEPTSRVQYHLPPTESEG